MFYRFRRSLLFLLRRFSDSGNVFGAVEGGDSFRLTNPLLLTSTSVIVYLFSESGTVRETESVRTTSANSDNETLPLALNFWEFSLPPSP